MVGTVELLGFNGVTWRNFSKHSYQISGGRQWNLQVHIIIQNTQQLGIDLLKNIIAIAHGDQLTKMLQSFWALLFLGISWN